MRVFLRFVSGVCVFAASSALAAFVFIAGSAEKAGAAKPATSAESTPLLAVVATVFPLELIARELAGERVTLASLVPPGASPHTFEPLPSDVKDLVRADLVLCIGGEYDAWIRKLLSAGHKELHVVKVIELPGLVPLSADPRAVVHEESSAQLTDSKAHPSRQASDVDPHVWTDPLRVRDAIAPGVAHALIELDVKGEAHYREHLANFQRRLSELDAEIRALLTRAPQRNYVSFHAAWRYFAARYGLTEVAVVQETGGEEPAPGELARLVRTAAAKQVTTILIEPQLNPELARVLAAEFGGRTILVDPLGTPAVKERANYVDLMRFNARNFARALSRSAEPASEAGAP